MSQSSAPHESDADAVFAAFVAQARSEGAVDIESVCRAHPALADELRRRHADWIFSGLESADPVVTARGGDWSEFIKRLRRRQVEASRYELQSEVARGGMGVVLRVFDRDLLRSLAMKVVRPGGGESIARGAAGTRETQPVVARFLEEAQVTGQLDHPGIVPVHDVGVDAEGRVFYTMKLVRGADLRAVLDKKKSGDSQWNLARVVSVLQRVADAMSYAHDKGVIHRDLKPANVMIGRYGETYVMDWGLARPFTRRGPAPAERPNLESSVVRTLRVPGASDDSPHATLEGEAMGTPCFMAPEQAAGRLSDLGPWTDVYAVGAMLYELLAGTRPYADDGGASAHEVIARVAAGPPTPILHLVHDSKDAPPELVAICEKAMARSIGARYASMRALSDDLRAWLEGRVVSAHATGPLAELTKWVLRNKAVAALAGGAVVVIASLVAAFVVKLDRERNVAVAERARVLRLADMKKLDELRASAETLWPADESHVGALTAWLAAADDLLGRRAQHEQTLAELRAAGARERGDAAVTDDELRWWRETLAGFLADLAKFAGDDVRGATRASVAARLAFANTVRARTIDEHRAEWDAVIAEIADPVRSPRYQGLKIAPQVGLIPLGRDPTSGLQEFAHLASGKPASRRADGRLEIGDATGIVLVLVPGGTFAQGAQSIDANRTAFDAAALPDESPVMAVTLAPFFLSKFEMTQSQWTSFTGANPSFYPVGSITNEGQKIAWTAPVEQVTWTQARGCLERLGLRLPTESQWEFACRAGTTTPWWSGAARESLAGAINLADESARRLNADWNALDDWRGFDDGFPIHAPVDTLLANPFGLHHMHGNVSEWCEDGTLRYSSPHREGDGLLEGEEFDFKITRGGNFAGTANESRSSARAPFHKDTSRSFLGVRPARPLDPPRAESR